jgi:hypothetical protein
MGGGSDGTSILGGADGSDDGTGDNSSGNTGTGVDQTGAPTTGYIGPSEDDPSSVNATGTYTVNTGTTTTYNIYGNVATTEINNTGNDYGVYQQTDGTSITMGVDYSTETKNESKSK